MRVKDKHILWPVYFDATKPRKHGRRVSLRLAVPSPSMEDIAGAVQKLGINAESSSEAAHPRTWWNGGGRVTVAKDTRKTQLIRQVAEELRRSRPEAEHTPTKTARK